MTSVRTHPEKILVAFSFADEQRDLVRSIAEAVEQQLGRGTVFFDEWYKDWLPGGPSDLKLQDIYKEQAELVVVCASQAYGEKRWTLVEWDAIRARYMRLRADSDRNATDRILPLRVAEGDVEGLLENTIWDDGRKDTPKMVAERIVRRVRRFLPDAGKPCVFLAECTSDLDDEDKPVNRQRLKTDLEELGWSVLPRFPLTEQPADRYRSLLETDLGQSLAFVQLVGPYPWKGGAYDRVQYDAAKQSELPMFRFRGEVDLKKLESSNPTHYQFINEGVIAGGFQDFKRLLREKLTALAQQREQAIKRAQDDDRRPADDSNPPLVRISIRARQPDVVWEQVFKLLYDQENILFDQLGPGETFKEKHLGEPCHGFLILCDGGALDDARHSPRGDMEHCRLIQMQEKDPARRPPVGLVYWPPPQPGWPKLLQTMTLRLHRVEGDRLNNLAEFLEQVRGVRRASS